jgi:hypothetical protein
MKLPGCVGPILLVASVTLVAARPAGADTTQWWPSLTVLSPSSNPWRGSLEGQTRVVDAEVDRQDGFNRNILRLQGGRAVHRRAVLWFGYEKTWPIENRTRAEQRIWQQLETSHPVGRWTFANRARLEQRFLRQADGTALRFRYRFRVARQLDAKGLWSAMAAEEVLFHLNSVELGPRRGFEQHRTSIGVSRRLGSLTIEQAYTRQQIRMREVRDPVNHLIQTTFTYRF